MSPTLLSDQSIPAVSGQPPESVVVFLHGYGADGSDLLSIAPSWQSALPNAAFHAPNAPEMCAMNPMGYQWFALSSLSRDEVEEGAIKAAEHLNHYLDNLLLQYELPASKLAVVGFSQGTMVSLYTCLKRSEALAGLVGYSGMLPHAQKIDPQAITKFPVFLGHGDADPIVPVEGSIEAHRVLEQAGFEVSLHIAKGMPHTIDPEGLQKGLSFLQQKLT